MRLPAFALIASVVLAASVPGVAQTPEPIRIDDRDQAVALLAQYAGSGWVGRGQSRSDFEDPLEDTSCRVDAAFDAATATLTNSGRCATTARAVRVDGDVTISREGDLTGGYFGRFESAELLSSNGFVHADGFVVEATYRAEIRREVQEISVRISATSPQLRPDGRLGFNLLVEVISPDTGEYVPFSILEFALPSGA
jgi:hypothetical protein